MSEAFRQQLAAAGEYAGVASTLSSETAKLVAAARKVQEHNERLIVRERSNRWGLMALTALLLFLVGGLTGILLDRQQTIELISNIVTRVEQVRTSALPIVEDPGSVRRSH
jgi:hypothetical protein